jgi:hypothetical protein
MRLFRWRCASSKYAARYHRAVDGPSRLSRADAKYLQDPETSERRDAAVLGDAEVHHGPSAANGKRRQLFFFALPMWPRPMKRFAERNTDDRRL